MTNGIGNLSGMNLNEIQSYNLSNSKEVISTLDQVLNFVDGRVPILIDIKKDFSRRSFFAVLKSIKNYDGQIAIQSHDPLTVFLFRILAPDVVRGQVASTYINHPKISGIAQIVLRNMWLNNVTHPDFVSYGLHKLNDNDILQLKSINQSKDPYFAMDSKRLRRANYCN